MSCRICFTSEKGGGLLQPCKCDGTRRFVHEQCFFGWQRHRDPSLFASCEICGYVFRYEVSLLRSLFRYPPVLFCTSLALLSLTCCLCAFCFAVVTDNPLECLIRWVLQVVGSGFTIAIGCGVLGLLADQCLGIVRKEGVALTWQQILFFGCLFTILGSTFRFSGTEGVGLIVFLAALPWLLQEISRMLQARVGQHVICLQQVSH